MKLSEFISETLTEIMEGVVMAQKGWADGGAKGTINPAYGGYEVAKENIREVSFDVAVTVGESSVGGLKGGVKVVGLGEMGGDSSSSTNSSKVSRIAFSIPIAPPIVFIEFEPGSSPFRTEAG